jgi:hypothetical protein
MTERVRDSGAAESKGAKPNRMPVLKAPFPYAGGKSWIAPLVWPRFGNPVNYVEPF